MWHNGLVQVECGILKRSPVKFARSQAGFLLNLIFKTSSVKDGLAVVKQSENNEKPRQPALHLHFVTKRDFILANVRMVIMFYLFLLNNLFPIISKATISPTLIESIISDVKLSRESLKIKSISHSPKKRPTVKTLQ